MSSQRRFMLVLPAALCVLMLSACGATTPSPSPTPTATSGVQGTVMWAGGPAVSINGASPTSQQGPLPGVTVLVHRGDIGGEVVAKVKADGSGRFLVELPPGTFTLVAQIQGGVARETLTVESGKLTKTTLWESVP